MKKNILHKLSSLSKYALAASVLALVSLTQIASGSEKTVTIDFATQDRRLDLGQGTLEFDGFSSQDLPSGLSLALETVTIPVAGNATSVSVSFGSRELVGSIDPNLLSSVDIPTADDDRYDLVRPALAEFFVDGFKAPLSADLVGANSGQVVRMTISPYEIMSDGSVFALRDLIVTLQSATPLTVGEPVFGEYIPQSEAGPNRSAGFSVSYPELIIITNETLSGEMQRLAEYRGATGVLSEVRLIEDILLSYAGIDDAEALRNYLKQTYANGATHILLAGDETVIPIRHTCYYNTSVQPTLENLMVCDLYFADLTGDWDVDGDGIWGEPSDDNPDLTAELKIGRLPISQIWQAKNYVDKLILYETDPGFGDRSYLEKALVFSSDQMRDHTESGQHSIIASAMPDYLSVDTFEVVEAPRGDASSPTNLDGIESVSHLNDGFGVVNVIAHGRHDGFVVRSSGYNQWPKSYIFSENVIAGHGNLDSLIPNGKTGLYVALSCDLAGFDFDLPPISAPTVSFVEKMIGAEYSGAVAMVANSRWGWVYSSYRLQREFLDKLYGEANGDPLLAVSLSEARYPYYRDLIYGQNYYGDPTIRLHLSIPGETHLETDVREWGSGRVYALVTINGAPLAGQQVILSQAGQPLAEANTDQQGAATLNYNFTLGDNYVLSVAPQGGLVALETFSASLASDVETDNDATLPRVFSLNQNYPNPFNPSTTVSWSQPASSLVTFRTLDILGRTVYEVELGVLPAGNHSIQWNGTNNSGVTVSSGIYFYQIKTGESLATRKMNFLK